MFLIKHFISVGIHLGHKTNKWNPQAASFLFATRKDIHIIDVEQTIPMIRRALSFAKGVSEKRGGANLLSLSLEFYSAPPTFGAGTRWQNLLGRQSPRTFPRTRERGQTSNAGIEDVAGPVSAPSCSGRDTALEELRLGPALLGSSRRTPRRTRGLPQEDGGAAFIPEVLFVPNVNENAILVKEAIKLQIPIIGVIDSDSNPFGIQYPIPGNAASVEAILLYTSLLQNVISEAKRDELRAVVPGRENLLSHA